LCLNAARPQERIKNILPQKGNKKGKRSFNIEALVYDLDLYHRPFHLFFSFSLERKSFENAPQVGGGTFLKRSIDSTHRQTPACG
jgi:hypothetical protein